MPSNNKKNSITDTINETITKVATITKRSKSKPTKKFEIIRKNFTNNELLESKFKEDEKVFDFFESTENTLSQKKDEITMLFSDFINSIIDILENKLNPASSIETKKKCTTEFLWKLKKLIVLVNNINYLKHKNNLL